MAVSSDHPEKEIRKKSKLRETVDALLTALVVAFLIRSFVVEPFKIPSRSMVPTLLVGDHIFVNKFAYGIRIPWTKWWPIKGDDPERGEVIVFIYPKDESLDFIKRCVGVPGDEIRYDGDAFYVNGNKLEVTDYAISGVDPRDPRRLALANAAAFPESLQTVPYATGYTQFEIGVETLNSTSHMVQYYKNYTNREPFTLTVPDGHFFAMGDNRDQSADSREWGFVPRENLKGHAMFIWLSIDSDSGGIRWKRFGKPII